MQARLFFLFIWCNYFVVWLCWLWLHLEGFLANFWVTHIFLSVGSVDFLSWSSLLCLWFQPLWLFWGCFSLIGPAPIIWLPCVWGGPWASDRIKGCVGPSSFTVWWVEEDGLVNNCRVLQCVDRYAVAFWAGELALTLHLSLLSDSIQWKTVEEEKLRKGEKM